MGYQTLISERDGGIATITLNRPQALNALDLVMRRELASVLDEVEADEAARVMILTGAGGNFCAGGDVKTMRARRHTAAEGRARVESLNRMVLRLVDFPKPTIAMVDGYAVGAGSNLALCCDLIVASDRARFGELFWKIGLVPDGGGTWLLSRVVGLARAKELIFTADVIDATEAARIGLVNRVVPATELMATTRALAEKDDALAGCIAVVESAYRRSEPEHRSFREKADEFYRLYRGFSDFRENRATPYRDQDSSLVSVFARS